jgi:hypothetical protein
VATIDPQKVKSELVDRHVRWAYGAGGEPSVPAVELEVSRGLERGERINASVAGKIKPSGARGRERPGLAHAAAAASGSVLTVKAAGKQKRQKRQRDFMSKLERKLRALVSARVALVMTRGREAGIGTELWTLALELAGISLQVSAAAGPFRGMDSAQVIDEQAKRVIAVCDRSIAKLGPWR